MRLQRVLFGHRVYNGIGCAIGVFAVALVGYVLHGLELAMVMNAAALTLSTNDQPCPPGGKVRQLAPAFFGIVLVTALTTVARGHPLGMGALVLAVGFVASMLTAFGRPGIPLGFALVFALVFGMALPADTRGPLERILTFTVGALLYFLYALVLNRLLAVRTKSQVLADALHGFADFLHEKAALLRDGRDHEAHLQAVLRRQAALAERLQVANEFIFRQVRGDRGGDLATTLLLLHDACESALSLQTEQQRLQACYGDAAILPVLAASLEAGAARMDAVAMAVMRNAALPGGPSLGAGLHTSDAAVRALVTRDLARPGSARDAILLRGLHAKLGLLLADLDALSASLVRNAEQRPLPRADEVRAWVTRVRYRPEALWNHLRSPRSPILRFALRNTLAMGLGYATVLWMPYAAHTQWVILTIAAVLRSSYSLTRQRRSQRIAGTVIGCLVVGALLHVVQAPLALLPVMVAAMAVSHAFATIEYRYAATAASIAGLLQLHLLSPGLQFVITERIADTLIGAFIAWACSFVFANWERESLPRLTHRALETARQFADTALRREPPAADYRLGRKRMLDAQADLTTALARMSEEPPARRHPVEPFERFLAANYALAGQFASLRFLLLRYASQLPPEVIDAALAQTHASVLARIGSNAQAKCDTASAAPEPATGNETDPAQILQRRLAQVRAHADTLAEAAHELPYQTTGHAQAGRA